MKGRRVADVGRFLDEAGPLLLADEARNNLVLGLAAALRDAPDEGAALWLVEDGGAAVAAALRTPPYNLVLAGPSPPAALAALAAAIDEELPGVVGGRPEAEAFARLWAEDRPVRPRLLREQGIYALEAVRPVPRPPGRARRAERRDRPLLVAWLAAFGEEALEDGDPGRADPGATVERRLAGDAEGGFLLWEDGGEVVSLAGWDGPTPNGVRVGPVYTPPSRRGRGYATGLVAELSELLLAAGRRFCFLYTDLANPTSNAIYERIGYVRVCESAMIAFEAEAGR